MEWEDSFVFVECVVSYYVSSLSYCGRLSACMVSEVSVARGGEGGRICLMDSNKYHGHEIIEWGDGTITAGNSQLVTSRLGPQVLGSRPEDHNLHSSPVIWHSSAETMAHADVIPK